MAPTMRAAQYDKQNLKILVHDIPVPEPKEGQFQVKIRAASLCHSDLMNHQRPDNIKRPITMGHEAVGVISEIHPSVKDKGFKVGDKIGMMYVIDNCFECDGCVVHGTFCINPTDGFAKIQGLQADGYFAEYAIIDWRNAIHLPDSLPIDRSSPIFCAGITAFHSVDGCELQPGQWLAIVGCGGLGQLACRYAKAMGAKVVAMDISDKTLERVKKYGADVTINTKTNPKFTKELRKITGLRGVHAAAVFSDSNAAFDSARAALNFDGILMVVGLPKKPLEIPAFAISLGMIRVKGGSTKTAADMKKAVDFTAKHQIIPEVEFRSLEEMPQMWEQMEKGQAERRQCVLFGDSKSKI